MLKLVPVTGQRPLRVLCLGAHSDDIEIGCAGFLFELLQRGPTVLTWAVFAASDERAAEARRSADVFLRAAKSGEVVLCSFTDGFFPAQFKEIKTQFETLKRKISPDLVLTHRLEDRHQDHRVIAELTWNTWRDHLILEYEIPKYEGDLGLPNAFVPLTARTRSRKLSHLMRYFSSQRSKTWFRREVFDAMMALRGVECRAPSGFAEAFYARKFTL